MTEVLLDDKYKVRMQGQESTIKSMNGSKYLLNDVVYILVFNGNESDKKILCKK